MRALLSGQGVRGPAIREFEERFASYHGVRHAVAASYGRMAFYYILRALDLPAGSEILIPALTFWVVPEMARVAGLRPVFVDVDPHTYTLDPRALATALTERTRAVVPTHLYGQPCDMEAILTVAERHGLIVIEDCAHALGATYRGRKVGTFGHAAFFSFQLLKGLNTYGGGMAITDDDALARRIRRLAEAEPWPSALSVLGKLVLGWLQQVFISPRGFTFSLFPVFWLVQVLKRGADDDPSQLFSLSQAHCGLFGLALDDEMPVLDEHIGHIRGERPEETYGHPQSLTGGLRPADLISEIHHRSQNQREITGNKLAPRDHDFMPRLREDRRQIPELDARQIVIDSQHPLHEPRRPGSSSKSRSVSPGNRILRDESIAPLNISENDSHLAPPESTPAYSLGGRAFRECRLNEALLR